MKTRLHFAAPLLAALIGCSESVTDPGATPAKQIPTSLLAWAPSADLSLPGDAVVQILGWETRWDSVVNLARYSADARRNLAKIFADWESRKPKAQAWQYRDTLSQIGGNLYLVAFSVDGIPQGGLVWVPTTTAPTPVILFGHPGDDGVNNTFFSVLSLLMGTAIKDQCIVVMPAYRGETASISDPSVVGDPLQASPWDRDVDDALAMLQAVLDNFPQSDASRIAAVGYSRGGGVALLSALRDRRIKSVFEIAGPTDFFAGSIQNLSKDLAAGKTVDLPGLDMIESRYLVPFRNGAISADSLRAVLLARSAGRLAISGLLPTTVAIHGAADITVFPDQSASLKAADSRVDYQSISGMNHSFTGAAQAKVAQSLQTFLKTVFHLN